MISGATYSGVPQKVHVFLPRPTFLANPKSTCGNKRTTHPYFLSETPECGRPHQLGVASVVQDDVLRLEVSVDDSAGVQEGQSLDDAARVEPSGAVVE